MDRSDILTLEDPGGFRRDSRGVVRATAATREIFCRVDSVSLQEATGGGQEKLRQALRFTILAAEYQGEPVVIYRGTRYSVYRTYQSTTDLLELYGEVKAGV